MMLGAAALDPESTFSRALSTNGALPTPDATAWNDPRVYQAEMPAANGISNGRSLARLYAATVSEVDGSPLLSPDSFGHQGAGGALGFGDVRHKVGFGYVQNQLLAGGPAGDPRTRGLIAAVARAVGA